MFVRREETERRGGGWGERKERGGREEGEGEEKIGQDRQSDNGPRPEPFRRETRLFPCLFPRVTSVRTRKWRA